MGKEGEGSVGRYGAGEVVGGGMVDCGEDNIVGLGYVLCSVRAAKRNRIRIGMKRLPGHCCVRPKWHSSSGPRRAAQQGPGLLSMEGHGEDRGRASVWMMS